MALTSQIAGVDRRVLGQKVCDLSAYRSEIIAAVDFMILEGRHYCISKTYSADDEEVFVLFKMLRNLKQLIMKDMSLKTQ